ncbi:lipase family protein, partial [Dyella japonica]
MTIPTSDYAFLSSLVYHDLAVQQIVQGGGARYEVLHVSGLSVDGYSGAVFKNLDTGELVVSHAGTEPSDIHDILADVPMGLGEPPTQWPEASATMQWAAEYAARNDNPSISVTGHSLGGALAQLSAIAYGVHADTFNSYGAYNVAQNLEMNLDIALDLVTNHRDAFDPVSQLSRQVGRDLMYMSDAEAAAYSNYGVEGAWEKFSATLSAHSISNFWEDGAPGVLLTDNRWGDVVSGDLPGALDHIGSDLREQLAKLKSSLSDAFNIFLSQLELAANAIVQGNTYRIQRYDPLALDLDGDGKVSTRAEDNWTGVLFDHNGDGIRTASGWVAGNDGLLVRDLNGNGLIDSGRELFGDQTLLRSGQFAANGFDALADLDDNGDGVIDANDAAFGSLRVWRDLNGDGISQANELFTLDDLGIVSLSLTHS